MKKLMVSLAILFFSVSSGWATTIHVPDDYPKIQMAIWMAFDGDTVLVADGTYTGSGNKDIDYEGKSITVLSENGAESTVIDCENDGRGFWFHSDEDSLSRLEGFSLQNGNDYYGGGIYCDNSSSPTITNCTITGNTVSIYGGGIYCDNSSSPTITNCTISENISTYGGGGIACTNASSPYIMYCNIIDNEALLDAGGGIYLHDDGTMPIITNCVILGNITSERGGGMYTGYVDSRITNCIFSFNTASDYGGGVLSGASNLTFQNCTFANNSVLTNGSELGCLDYSTNVLSNCILWGDGLGIIYENKSDLTVTYSDVKGGWSGTGNIDTDPLFADAANYDFHLTEGSPCIDTGTDAGVYEDFEGDVRPWGSGFDMGADEFVDCLVLVSTILECDEPIVIRGGLLEYRAGLKNNTDEEQTEDVWLDLYLINGEPYPKNPYLGPLSVTLGPNYEIVQNRQEYVPVIAPLGGPYTLFLRVGTYPDILDESFFEFDVVPENK